MKKIITQTLCLIFFIVPFALKAQQARFISVKGKEIIGPDKKPFLMRGTNLGNWLVPEGYMFKFKSVNSPRLINQALSELVGPEEAAAFWRKYQDSYITEGDISVMQRKLSNKAPYKTLYPNHTYTKANGELYKPGEHVELVFDLLPISYEIKAGHKLRVSIAGTDAGHFNLPFPKPTCFQIMSTVHDISYIELPMVSGN